MRRKHRGFTLVEVMISIAIFAIIASVLFMILIRNQRSARITTNLVEAQQNARVAIDVLARDIRVAGYGIDIQNEQPAVQYAGSFEIMFNANMVPYPDTTDPRGDPTAVHWGGGNLPPHSRRTPAQDDTTGAETIVYTLDFNMDGSINGQDVSASTGNPQAAETYNPNDMMLMRQVYGYSSATGGNVISSDEVAMIRGPLPAGQVVEPLFLYWLDTNSDGVADSLYGDSNNDGELSNAEISALTPLVWPVDAMDLRRVARVTITAIGEMPERDRGYKFNNGYRQVRVTSDVTVGSNVLLPINVVQRTISGNVFRDCYEDQTGTEGVSDWRVDITDLLYDKTDMDGAFEFVMPPGRYDIWIHDILNDYAGWHLTTSHPADSIKLNIDVTVRDTSGLTWYVNSPFGNLQGVIFHDVNNNSVYNPPPGGSDTLISDNSIVGWRVKAIGPVYNILTPTIDSIWQDVEVPDSDYAWTADEDNFFMQDSTYTLKVTPLDVLPPNPFAVEWEGESLVVTMPNVCDFYDTVNVPLVAASPPPQCSLYPVGTLLGADLKWIRWHMEDPDDPIDSLTASLQYSLDAGVHWHPAKTAGLGDTALQWFVPPVATQELMLWLTVDDPDPDNESCNDLTGLLSISYPFVMRPSGLFVIRDKAIYAYPYWQNCRTGVNINDTLDPANGTSFAEVVQEMPRMLRIPRTDTLEEDTAVAYLTGIDTVDITVYEQLDTMCSFPSNMWEGATEGDVYSDSAVWVSEHTDPLGDTMWPGPWRFYLWGNYDYQSSDTFLVKTTFLVELYCIDDDGQDPVLMFQAMEPGLFLFRRDKRDFIEIRHIDSGFGQCERFMMKVKAVRLDNEPIDVKVYFYYNGPSSSYLLTPRVPE
jgi:prepilin-type N-terminal cleavage/methylation domain-containing protein